jgi:hypothetical protein
MRDREQRNQQNARKLKVYANSRERDCSAAGERACVEVTNMEWLYMEVVGR